MYFPLTPNTDREFCRQPYSSGGFEGSIQQQTARRLIHACQRDQEGFPLQLTSSVGIHEHNNMVFFPACPGTDAASLIWSLHPDGHKHLPLCWSLPSLLWMRSCWFLVSALNIRYSQWHGPETMQLLPSHWASKQMHQVIQPLMHLRRHYLPSSALSKTQLNCFQSRPLTFWHQAHTNTCWVTSI